MADATANVEETLGSAASPPLPPEALIIVPVRGMVLFPGTVLPITLGRPRSVLAAQRAVREQKPVGVVMQSVAVMSPIPFRWTCIAWGRSPTSSATSLLLMEPIISFARESKGSGSMIT